MSWGTHKNKCNSSVSLPLHTSNHLLQHPCIPCPGTGGSGYFLFPIHFIAGILLRFELVVLFFCVDGLAGFKEAIGAVYPDAQIQRCVIHMLRNSFKYVNYSDLRKFSSDFKAVYNAPNETSALSALEKMLYLASRNVIKKWTQRYKSWNQVPNQMVVLYEVFHSSK